MWAPANADHAIERAMITLIFDEDIPPKPFLRIQALVAYAAGLEGLDVQLPLQTLRMKVALPGPAQAAQAGVIPETIQSGTVFRSLQNGLVRHETLCSINNLNVASLFYASWKDFIDRVERLLSDAVDLALKVVSVKEIRLEYWDRFERKCAGPGAGDPLIKPQSALIPDFYGQRSESWHNHIGFFTDRIVGCRALMNANVDVVANPQTGNRFFEDGIEAQARIYTAATIYSEGSRSAADSWSDIRKVAELQHDALKAMLGEIIHPDLANLINLNALPF